MFLKNIPIKICYKQNTCRKEELLLPSPTLPQCAARRAPWQTRTVGETSSGFRASHLRMVRESNQTCISSFLGS